MDYQAQLAQATHNQSAASHPKAMRGSTQVGSVWVEDDHAADEQLRLECARLAFVDGCVDLKQAAAIYAFVKGTLPHPLQSL